MSGNMMQLRRYQERIIEDVGTSNALIVLPTGSGKTVVAAEIIRNQLHKEAVGGNRIAIFIVPSRALVEQQAVALASWTKLRVATYCGGRKTPSTMMFDILVATPCSFLSLQDRFEMLSWMKVCICVLDEVHHTQKNHPYRTIASSIEQDSARCTIQIIGLTASLVYDMEQDGIQKSLNNLIVSLRIHYICSPTENDLRSEGYHPQAQTIDRENSSIVRVGIPKDTLFDRLKSGRASKVEQMVFHVVRDMEAEAFRLLRDFESPLARKSSEWEEYAVKMSAKKMMADDDGSIFFKKLGDIYVALRLLADGMHNDEDEEITLAWMKTQKVLTGIDESWGACLSESSQRLKLLVLEYNFRRLFQLRKQLMEAIAIQPEGNRPGQAIIFVEKRITARIVSEYLEQDEDMQRKGIITGYVTAAVDRSEMTPQEIKERINHFRSGKMHILVATAVVEEGLDVPNVKIVVLFDLIHSSVVLCQRFGRARDIQPKIIVLSERSGRSIDALQRSKEDQNNVIENIFRNKPRPDYVRPSAVDCTADKSREKAAFDKFLLDECIMNKRPSAVLNEFKDKTKGRLKKSIEPHIECTFLCKLEYTSVLRKEGFDARDVGSSKKDAERKCALKVLLRLRSVLSKDYLPITPAVGGSLLSTSSAEDLLAHLFHD